MRIRFGKYRGELIEDLPLDYLFWMSEKMESGFWREVANEEIERRRNARRQRTEQPIRLDFNGMVKEIVEAGYKALARKFHPDMGGDLQKIQQLNATMEKLRK